MHSSIVDTRNFDPLRHPWKHLSLSLQQQTSIHLRACCRRLNAYLHTCSELSWTSVECHMKLLLSSMQLPAGVDLEAAQMWFNKAVSLTLTEMYSVPVTQARAKALFCKIDLQRCKSNTQSLEEGVSAKKQDAFQQSPRHHSGGGGECMQIKNITFSSKSKLSKLNTLPGSKHCKHFCPCLLC